MLLKNLKKNMILPKKEILIDKIVKIKGIDVHLVSITSEGDRNVLWLMYESLYDIDELVDLEERKECTSNRDKMINNIEKEDKGHSLCVSEITIQNQKMIFTSSSRSYIREEFNKGYMHLQHFIERGISTRNWDEVNISNIVIAAYEQRKDQKFPEIDLSKELDIKIKIKEESKRVLITQPIKLEFGEMEKGKKFYFYDSVNNKERVFYIDRVKHYNFRERIGEEFNSEEIGNFPKEKIKKMKKMYLASLEEICPKGMDLAILEYETEDDIQLNFYTNEYLDKKPCYKNSASTVIFKSDEELGINGLKNRMCMLKPVKKDFYDSIDCELFSWCMKIPGEVIVV